MKAIQYLILLLITGSFSVAVGSIFKNDSTKAIKGRWILSGDSIDTSIGNNIDTVPYDGKQTLFDTLIFKKNKYYFKNSISKDPIVYGEKGHFFIRADSLILSTKVYPFNYSYKINKLSNTELIIEETLYSDTYGVFRLIGYYKKNPDN